MSKESEHYERGEKMNWKDRYFVITFYLGIFGGLALVILGAGVLKSLEVAFFGVGFCMLPFASMIIDMGLDDKSRGENNE